MRSIAASYPADRPRTLLVLADDSVLAAAAAGKVDRRWLRWPLPLSAWSAALDQAQARRTKVVLLDVGLIDRRDIADERELLETLKLVAQTTDVFLVDPGNYPTGETLTAWLVRKAGSLRVHLVSPERAPISGFSTTYLVKPQRLSSPIAAVAMARVYCREEASRCAQGAPQLDRIELWWPMPDCLPTAAKPHPCSTGWAASFVRASKLMLAQALSGVCENLPRLLSCSTLPSVTMPGFAIDEMALEDFASNRLPPSGDASPDAIVISQDFDMAQDVVRSPVYGITPGAHAHAVAFDNLVTLGRETITRKYPLGMSENFFLSLWIIAALVLGHAVRTMSRGLFGGSPDRFIPAMIIGLMLFLFLWYCFSQSVSPANWIAAYAALSIVWAGESRMERYVRNLLVRYARRRRLGGLLRRLVACIVKRR